MIRSRLKKSYPLVCAYYLADNYLSVLRHRIGDISTTSGTTLGRSGVAATLARIDRTYCDYKKFGGFRHFYGKVAELGPGDNCGVALLALRDGAESVDLVDRFYPRRRLEEEKGLYAALSEECPGLESPGSPRLRGVYGKGVESFFEGGAGYDFILSCAVLEHLYDPLHALRMMAPALRPGGMMLHSVDLRDHGMFSEHFHELKFLEVPRSLYRRMTAGAGRPNRVLLDSYRRTLQEMEGMEFAFWIIGLAAVEKEFCARSLDEIPEPLRRQSLSYVRSVRENLDPQFAAIPAEELCVTRFFLAARKKASAGAEK